MAMQEEALRKHQPLIVVGTPGRLAEHSRKGTLGTHRTGLLILDEVRRPPVHAPQMLQPWRTAHSFQWMCAYASKLFPLISGSCAYLVEQADQLLAPNFREDMVRLTQHVGKKVETGRQTVKRPGSRQLMFIQESIAWQDA